MIAPGVPNEPALREFGEKVRGIVRMAPFSIGGSSLDVTVSVGATLIDGTLAPTDADGLINEALAKAKVKRDRVVLRLPPALQTGGPEEHTGAWSAGCAQTELASL